MAKSKSGGTRALLRGRVGSDVYSVGKDGMGKRQQVVRSLAEVVANPRTENQMFGRMIMSSVMQAVSAMSPIIDHSFDGAAKGQPSISEFIRRNYAAAKADALAHPASANTIGLNKYQEKGVKLGKWIISAGNVAVPATIEVEYANITVAKGTGDLTVAYVREAMNIGADGYVTWVGVYPSKGFVFCRVKLDPSATGTTVITTENLSTLFSFEGTTVGEASILQNGGLGFTFGASVLSGGYYGMIISKVENGAWKHSACTLDGSATASFAADEALPTYPTGNEAFLNGGEI